MSASTYEIKKKVTGGYSVSYSCPHCSAALVSTLKEAGTSQSCPTCQRPFVVPGKIELAEIERKAALALEQKAAREKAAQVEKQRAAEETLKNRRLSEQLEAEQKQIDMERERRSLFVQRKNAALQPQQVPGMGFGLQLVQLVIAFAAVLNLIGALFFAVTVIGIPLAIGCAVSFVICVAVHELIALAHDIRANTGEAIKHQQFQSSVLEAMYTELKAQAHGKDRSH